MVISIKSQAPVGTSVKSLIKGFVLTQRTDCKSPRTIEYYENNPRRFLWYADMQKWPEDVHVISEWHIREFLAYAGEAGNIYYCHTGSEKLLDQRTGKTYEFGQWIGEFVYGSYLNSQALDPQLDNRGHTTLPNYQDIGSQWP